MEEIIKQIEVKDYSDNGFLEFKGIKPKIKLIHLTTEPETNPKEIISVKNIKDFCNQMDIKYDLRVNKKK